MKVDSLSKQLLFNTVCLETYDVEGKPIGVGTSFLLSHSFDDYGEELFLVTNKHVVKGAWRACMYFHQFKDGALDFGNPFFVNYDDGFSAVCHGHPSEDIDIVVTPISLNLDLIGKDGVKAYYLKISTDMIPSQEEIEKFEAIRPILFVGYPNGMYDSKNYTPILRTGITATPIELDYCSKPVFLIDASVFPGSSGSPVYTYERTWAGGIADIKLLGILSAVFFRSDLGEIELLPAPTQVKPAVRLREMIDLGLVFKSHLIKETILDFWQKNGATMKEARRLARNSTASNA